MPDNDLDTLMPTIDTSSAEDWAKHTLDLPATNVEELRAALRAMGLTVEEFKQLPAYKLPLESGNYPWLADL